MVPSSPSPFKFLYLVFSPVCHSWFVRLPISGPRQRSSPRSTRSLSRFLQPFIPAIYVPHLPDTPTMTFILCLIHGSPRPSPLIPSRQISSTYPSRRRQCRRQSPSHERSNNCSASTSDESIASTLEETLASIEYIRSTYIYCSSTLQTRPARSILRTE